MLKYQQMLDKRREYKRLKKIANNWYCCSANFSVKAAVAHQNMVRLFSSGRSNAQPVGWGHSGVSCKMVQDNTTDLNPYVLDYNIGQVADNGVFYCPCYRENRYCGKFDCDYSSDNKKYFRYTELAELAHTRYLSACARADAAKISIWDILFGRTSK